MLQPQLIYGATAVAAYLLGAVPFGWLFVKLKTGQDVRTMGSGNIGATNVARVLGTGWFVPVFILDFLKGFAPVYWGAPFIAAAFPCPVCTHLSTALAVLYGLFATLGHMFPVYLGFKGGKGVATVGGIMFAMNWMAALITVAVWFLAFLPFRTVSIGSLASALALPIAHHFTARRLPGSGQWIVTCFFALASLLVIVRHRSNLRRLAAGTEPKFGRKDA